MYYRLKEIKPPASILTGWISQIYRTKLNNQITLILKDGDVIISRSDAHKVDPFNNLGSSFVGHTHVLVWRRGASNINKIANKVNNNFLNNFK